MTPMEKKKKIIIIIIIIIIVIIVKNQRREERTRDWQEKTTSWPIPEMYRRSGE